MSIKRYLKLEWDWPVSDLAEELNLEVALNNSNPHLAMRPTDIEQVNFHFN
jgi:hypothetical protein